MLVNINLCFVVDDGSHELSSSTSLRGPKIRATLDEREKPQQFRKK